MAALKFASSHNMVAFLDKPTESDGFEQIVDFLNAHPIKYALTVNPIIYTSCIEQFWTTAKVKTVDGEVQIQALVDKKKVIITETSIRSDLQLEDAEGTECLPNAIIFEQLILMGYENLTQKLTLYKAFFSPQWKFLIHTILQCLGAKTTAWNEFSSTMASAVILFLDKQVEGMSKHKKIYVTPSHTKKFFANTKRHVKEFLKKKPRKSKKQDTQDSQPSGPTEPMANETKNMESVPTPSNDPLLNGEERQKLNELMELYTNLSQRVLDLENTKTSQAAEITKLKERVKKLERKNNSRTPGLKRLRKVDEQEVEVEKVVSTAEVTTASATITTVDELTLAQTLIEIKATKPKAVTTAATTTTTAVTRPKARGVVVQEPTELEEEERLARQKEEDANIAEWNNDQAMIDAYYELAARLQVQEQEELTIEERSKMFVELLDKRKKHFARLRAEEQRRKPPTKAHKRNMDTKLVKESSKKAVMVQESSSKRVGEGLESDNSKKQKLDENVEAEVDDEAEMKKHMEIVSDDEVAIDAIPLATKPPIIVD
ncbi:hypothetical protein Tco_1517465 [Tanacetum coccineum]